MISLSYRAIYIHQRKAAGTSIKTSFGFSPEMPQWHLYNEGVLAPEWSARSASETAYFIFSSVRNPFDRLVSAWKYLKTTRNRPLEEVLANPPLEGHDYRHFTRPQAASLCDATGHLVVQDLIRFESLQDDYDRISRTLDKPQVKLGCINAGRREHQWRPYFTAEARSLAEAMFEADLTFFDYEF